jgi:hypothetical protein
MGDSNTNNDDTLEDYNELHQDSHIDGKTQGTPPLDWTFNDEHEALSKCGDASFYDPYVPKPPRGSVEDIQYRLRTTGLRLRKDLNRSVLLRPQHWTALRRPASLHSAQRTLAEMLVSLPSEDQGHFHELGDGYAHMPLHAFEKFLYPTLRVMQHLHSNKGQYDYIPGGVESMIVYSYFHQGMGSPPNRTERDLRVSSSPREATFLNNFEPTLKSRRVSPPTCAPR